MGKENDVLEEGRSRLSSLIIDSHRYHTFVLLFYLAQICVSFYGLSFDMFASFFL